MQAAVIGVPGTGKTYFMVYYLQKYFNYDAFFREYTISKDVLILTNIDGLKFYGASCWDIESPEILGKPDEKIPGKYTREEFFTVPNMQKIMEKTGKKNIILVIDEIQRDHYFPLGYKDPVVLYLFAYHRHIGMDIILGTQDQGLISRAVLAQCEYLAFGTLRSKKIWGAMSYSFTDNKGRPMYSTVLKTDKNVFNAYQSMTTDEVAKPKNALAHWVIVVFVLLLVGGGLFKSALAIISNKSKPKPQANVAVARYAPGALQTAGVLPYQTTVPVPVGQAVPGQVQGQAQVNNISPLPVMPVIPLVPIWREYAVEGYIRDGGRYHYLINGNYVDPVRCRNYNSRLHTVEYISLEPVPGRRDVSAGQGGAYGGGSGEASNRKGEALAEPPTPLVWNRPPPAEYKAISNL